MHIAEARVVGGIGTAEMAPMRPGRRTKAAWALGALLLAGCYDSFFAAAGEEGDVRAADGDTRDRSVPDDGVDAPPLEDGRADEASLDVPRPDDGGEPGDSEVRPSTHLEPETDAESFYGTASGMEVEVHSGWLVPAAFSGAVYELIMDEDVPWATDDGFAAIYRLVPGGERLETTWIDTAIDATQFGSICWSGEAFVVALPVLDVGIRVMAAGEDGRLLRDPVLLPDHDPARGGQVYCLTGGPVVLAGEGVTDASVHRLHYLGRDGTPAGTHVDLEPFFLAPNMWLPACAEAGADIACLTTATGSVTGAARIVFVARDGTVRESPALPSPLPCEGNNGCDIVFLGDGLGLVWSADEGGKPILTYARTDLGGNVVVGPVSTHHQVGIGPLGFHAATSGTTLFVVTEGVMVEGIYPAAAAHLLALDGTALGESLPLSRSCVWDPPPCTEGPAFWRGMAVFWEGDAYSAIWNTWPDAMVAYRRFLVVP